MRRRWLVLAAFGFAQPLQAEERTAANAFTFIQDMVTDGSWTGPARVCNARSQCFTEQDNRIISVAARDQSFCQISFSMAVTGTTSTAIRTIDLTRNFDVGYSSTDIWFNGPVAVTDGTIEPYWGMRAPSYQVAEQVGKALQFIYSKCRTPSIWQTGD